MQRISIGTTPHASHQCRFVLSRGLRKPQASHMNMSVGALWGMAGRLTNFLHLHRDEFVPPFADYCCTGVRPLFAGITFAVAAVCDWQTLDFVSGSATHESIWCIKQVHTVYLLDAAARRRARIIGPREIDRRGKIAPFRV